MTIMLPSGKECGEVRKGFIFKVELVLTEGVVL